MSLPALLLLACLSQAPAGPAGNAPETAAGGAATRAASPAAAADDGLPPTRFAQEVLASRPLLVIGRTVRVTNLGIGTAVVILRIEEHLLGNGPEVGDEVVVFAYAGHFHAEAQDLLLLQPFGEHGRFRVGMRIDGREPTYREKLEMTRQQIALLDEPDPTRRSQRTLSLLVAGLEAPGEWTRLYALRELLWLAELRPQVFDERWRASLERTALVSPWPEVQAGVENVTSRLAAPAGPLPAGTQQESSPP